MLNSQDILVYFFFPFKNTLHLKLIDNIADCSATGVERCCNRIVQIAIDSPQEARIAELEPVAEEPDYTDYSSAQDYKPEGQRNIVPAAGEECASGATSDYNYAAAGTGCSSSVEGPESREQWEQNLE